MITLETHQGITVLRDDLLPGGTKSVFLGLILNPAKRRYVYASPVYGAFQIALSRYAASIGKQAVIFTAKRKTPHANSLAAKEAGGLVLQVPAGYLSNCQAKAREYCRQRPDAEYLEFGANYPAAITAIAGRMRKISEMLPEGEPDEIFCALGSGTLMRGIAQGTDCAVIRAVQVGADYKEKLPERVQLIKYPMPFEKECPTPAPFPSCANYDRKAWETALKLHTPGCRTLFWNVF